MTGLPLFCTRTDTAIAFTETVAAALACGRRSPHRNSAARGAARRRSERSVSALILNRRAEPSHGLSASWVATRTAIASRAVSAGVAYLAIVFDFTGPIILAPEQKERASGHDDIALPSQSTLPPQPGFRMEWACSSTSYLLRRLRYSHHRVSGSGKSDGIGRLATNPIGGDSNRSSLLSATYAFAAVRAVSDIEV